MTAIRSTTACTQANLPKRQPPTHLLHHSLTTFGPPKRGVAPSIRNPRTRGNRLFPLNINRLPDSWRQARRRCWWCYPTVERAYELHPGDGGVTARSEPKLLDQVRDRLWTRHYSLRAEQAYPSWVRRFIPASSKCNLVQMAQVEVGAFLTLLGDPGTGVCGHTEPGVGGAVVSLPRRIAHRSASRVRRNPWFSQS
ncbi:phage integrase N-terminal SAM-like domain-containing protein [Xanthomonas citri]